MEGRRAHIPHRGLHGRSRVLACWAVASALSLSIMPLHASAAGFADFDGLTEGFVGNSLTTGGITFSNWKIEAGGGANALSIDDGSGWWSSSFPALGAYAQGKSLVALVNGPGPEPSFALLHSLDIAPAGGGVNTFASLNVVYQ